LPSPTQNAHKLAGKFILVRHLGFILFVIQLNVFLMIELAGNFADCGEKINNKRFANKLYFL